MAGLAGADLAVRRRVRLATGVADTRRTYAPEPLKGGLRGPESAERKVRNLRVATGGIDRVLSLSAHLGRFAMFGAHAGSGCWFLDKQRLDGDLYRLRHEESMPKPASQDKCLSRVPVPGTPCPIPYPLSTLQACTCGTQGLVGVVPCPCSINYSLKTPQQPSPPRHAHG